MSKKKIQASTNVPKYKKDIKQIYKKPNFDEYHKKLQEERVKKIVEDSRTQIVEIQGVNQADVNKKVIVNNMQNNLYYDPTEQQKKYLKEELDLQKQVLEVEKTEPVVNVPVAPKIPEVAIPKKKIDITADL